MALRGHGSRAAGTQGDRGDISEEFQLIRPVTLTLSGSMMTSIYKMGGWAQGQAGAHRPGPCCLADSPQAPEDGPQLLSLLPWHRPPDHTPPND